MPRNPNDLRFDPIEAPLDRIDRELIRALQNNARTPNKDLAKLVGVAQSTCLERVRRLRARGVVLGFHAEVDPKQLGRPTQAIIGVRLHVHAREQIRAFYEHVLQLPESLAVFHVSGADDYLVHVAVQDTEHLRVLVLDRLTARPEVERVETHLIFEFVRKQLIEPLD